MNPEDSAEYRAIHERRLPWKVEYEGSDLATDMVKRELSCDHISHELGMACRLRKGHEGKHANITYSSSSSIPAFRVEWGEKEDLT